MADAPRRRRWPRRLLITVISIALLLFFAPAIASHTGLIQNQANKALADFDGSATVGSATLGWLLPVELHDVTLKDAQGRTLATIPRIVTSQSLLGFLSDSQNSGTVTLEQPTIEIVCEHDATNLETSLKRLLEKPGDPNAPQPKLTIVMTNATLKVTDAEQKKEWILSEIEARAELGESVHVKAAIRKPESLEIDAVFGNQFAAMLNAERFPIEVLGPFLRRFEPGLRLAGNLSGQIASENSAISGSLTLRNLVAESPRLGSERLALDSLELPFKLTAIGTTINIDAAKLTCPIGEATLAGSFDTAAPGEKLIQQAGITASASLDLAKLAKLLPALLRLRPGTELQEGRIELHLASKPAAKGTLWDGNLKASALRGTRAGQPLRWEQPIIASFAGRIDEHFHADFDKLEAVADFAAISARGKLEDFTAEARVSLDVLAKHLGEFIDLTGITLAGSANLTVLGKPLGDSTSITGSLKLNDLAASSPSWQFAGRGELAGTLQSNEKQIVMQNLTGTLQNVRFRGLGLDLDEPVLNLYPTDAVIVRSTNRIEISRLQFATPTLTLGTNNIAITQEGVTLSASTNIDLARLQKMLELPGEPLAGIVHDGVIELKAINGSTHFTAKLPISNFRFGPSWSEAAIALNLTGDYDPKSDALKLSNATLDRPDGLAVQAHGTIDELSTRRMLDIAGQISYDLTTLEPQLKALLGTSVKARGKDSKPFHLKGDLENPTLLVGDASLGWQSLTAYGFDVGPSTLKANLSSGTLTATPLEATFNVTGKVKLQPTLTMKGNAFELTFEKGRVIDKASLTPAACSEALGFALPAIAKSSQAEGLISFDLEENRITLADLNRAAMKGKLTLHNVSVTPGPVISEVAKLFNQAQSKMTLAQDQVVAIRVENGRVYHENLVLMLGNFALVTSGSVGFDGTLSLQVQVPLPESEIGPLLKSVPAIRDGVVNKKISVPITGTLTKPQLDGPAYRAAVRQFVKEATRDAAKSKLSDLLRPAPEKPDGKKP